VEGIITKCQTVNGAVKGTNANDKATQNPLYNHTNCSFMRISSGKWEIIIRGKLGMLKSFERSVT
jgi:hypothetical protein